MIKDKIKKLELRIVTTKIDCTFGFVDKNNNLDATISEELAFRIYNSKENEKTIDAMLQKNCDKINNAVCSVARESISCADLNLDMVTA